MPRKAYIADVATATSQNIPGISSVARGSEDGDLNVCYVPMTGPPIEIGLLALGKSSFPILEMRTLPAFREGLLELCPP
jgi:ubiquitin-conjugating enzyme E2 Q